MRQLAMLALICVSIITDPAGAQRTPTPRRGIVFTPVPTVQGVPVRPAPDQKFPPVPAGAFYSAGLLIPDGSLSSVGALEEVVSPTVVPRTSLPQIQPYDRVFMRVSGPVAAGNHLHLMRADRSVLPYGRVYHATGIANVLSVDGSVAVVEVNRFYGRVEPGDIALPLPTYTPAPAGALVPSTGLDGVLVALSLPQPVVSTEDLALVNLGAASGVVEGDEFEVYLPAQAAEGVTRPEIRVGRLQVVRAGQTTSAVRVISLEHPALVEGLPVRLVGKMP